MNKSKPTYYGLTGADEKYIKEQGLVPDKDGAYPRLDVHSSVERIPSVGIRGEHTIPVDISDDDLRKEISKANVILDGLNKLYMSRGSWNKMKD